VKDRTLQNWMELIEQSAGIEDGTGRLHILRHTFCSRLADRGVPAGHIQKLAGHASITTTERYMHYSDEGLGKAIAALEIGPVRCISVANEQGSRRSPVSSSG
jgi:integrase